ncbi:hypothetical protein [Kutzneria sp. CA-103260]|uniref:hypothetical protein n=1 Tax=Kutzneria sp. CA-103260 TaxID=2802641 RepID=UPI001BABFAF3|nr:hypothetical protein [Kutzneria sp. CA-103260]QUQ70588.1 hypothetical protein JJ691_83680 [Kutzneria sp. CA-103260]
MSHDQVQTEQRARQQRALTHFHFAMAYLSVGDVPSADDYLLDVRSRDGDEMYRSVLDMIAIHTNTPLEP